MKVWISRNKTLLSDRVDIYINKPIYQSEVYVGIKENEFITEILIEDFKKVFKFTPRKGSCKQYELTLDRIENGKHSSL